MGLLGRMMQAQDLLVASGAAGGWEPTGHPGSTGYAEQQ